MTHPAEYRHRGVRPAMIFTEYVQSLRPGEEPDTESFAVLWSTLRGALFREMQKRGLTHVPPCCLGLYGWSSWSQPGALDELVSDCYTFIFLHRLAALKAQLEIKDNVEGLVFRNIRNFLYDAQKKHDPLGFRILAVLRRAVRRLVDDGVLHPPAGRGKLCGGTLLVFVATGAVSNRAVLETCAREWADDLLPEMVTARGRRLDAVVEALARRLARLPARGVEALRFRELSTAMKGAVRVRWGALWSRVEGETALQNGDDGLARRVRVVHPAADFEEQEAFAKLCAHVSAALENLEGRGNAGTDLHKLWGILRRQAGDCGNGKMLSRRRIARRLGVPRHRVTSLCATLGRWVDQFQAISG